MSGRRSSDHIDTRDLFGALNSPVRREILWLIWDRELPAGEIAAACNLSAPAMSQHLGVLRRAGLVTVERDGTFRRYRARQDAVAHVRSLLVEDDAKWATSSVPLAPMPHGTVSVVVVGIDAPCDQATSFRAFTDPVIYRRWAGVPVKLVDGRFSMTMEWGLKVRGTYDYVVEPALIVMTWDFDQHDVPVPGATLRAYLEITARGDDRSYLQIHQFIDDHRQAHRMERAWSLMLDRFRTHVVDAVNPEVRMPMRRRQRRPLSASD